MPFIVVGDGAFGLSQNVMRPDEGRNLTLKKRVYRRLSRACRHIECAFGILVMPNKWRILHRPLNVSDFVLGTYCKYLLVLN